MRVRSGATCALTLAFITAGIALFPASAMTKSSKMPVSVTVKRACKATVNKSHVTFTCDHDDHKERTGDSVRPSEKDAQSPLKITTTTSLTTVNF